MAAIPQSITITRPRTRLGSFSLGKLVTDIQETLKDFISTGIPLPLLETFYNDAVLTWFLAKLSGSVEYLQPFILPVLRSVLSNLQDDSSYDSDSKILTLPTSGDNISWVNCNSFGIPWVGTILTLTDNSGTPANYQATIVQYIETVNGLSSVLVSSSAPTIAAGDLIVQGSTTLNAEADELDLSDYQYYKRIFYIDKIVSTTGGLCVGPPKIDSKNFEGIKSTHKETWSNYVRQIIYNRQGEAMQFSLGGKLTSYGIRTFYTVLFPEAMVEQSDLIDVQDIWKPDIDKIVRIRAISSMPADMIKIRLNPEEHNWYKDIQQAAVAKQAEKTNT